MMHSLPDSCDGSGSLDDIALIAALLGAQHVQALKLANAAAHVAAAISSTTCSGGQSHSLKQLLRERQEQQSRPADTSGAQSHIVHLHAA